jgi:hypothetical protein
MTTTEFPPKQDTYLPPDVPPGYVTPPMSAAFANATWLLAGPDIVKQVNTLLKWEEFSDLRDLDFSVVWRRNGKPMRNGEPVFATAEITPPRFVWEALQLEVQNFPRFILDLRWPHFDDLRHGKTPGEPESEDDANQAPAGRGAQYVHRDVLAQHMHHALMSLDVENDIVHRRPPDFAGFAATVKRFGQWNSGAAAIAAQFELWPSAKE